MRPRFEPGAPYSIMLRGIFKSTEQPYYTRPHTRRRARKDIALGGTCCKARYRPRIHMAWITLSLALRMRLHVLQSRSALKPVYCDPNSSILS